MSDAVIILSGGLDSTVCAFWARERYERRHVLFINWMQKSIEREREAAFTIAKMTGASWQEITVPLFHELGTRLTLGSGPVTGAVDFFTRGCAFLGSAARYVETTGASALVHGITAEDALPEAHLEFVGYMEQAIGVCLQRPFKIESPLAAMTKAEIVALARTLPGCWDALRYSVSCFAGTRCGECKACLLRAKGFAANGVEDPAA